MSSYFYPTKSPLFEARFEKWKLSGREYLVFPFLKYMPNTLPKVWFKCDMAEEIKNTNGSFLNYSDFRALSGKDLCSSVRKSIAPVEVLSNFITVNSFK